MDNETIQLEIMNEEEEEITHRYSYKKLRIGSNSDKYEIILVRIDSINDNNSDEYVSDIVYEDNEEIIKKLKYKDLINIFNPNTNDYRKVIKLLNNS